MKRSLLAGGRVILGPWFFDLLRWREERDGYHGLPFLKSPLCVAPDRAVLDVHSFEDSDETRFRYFTTELRFR